MTSVNFAVSFSEALIEWENATARRMGTTSSPYPDPSAVRPARFARPFQQPTIFTASSRLISLFSSATWDCRLRAM